MIVQTVLCAALVYLGLVLVQHIYRYKQWSRVTAQTTSFEPWHPFWGHMHLVYSIVLLILYNYYST